MASSRDRPSNTSNEFSQSITISKEDKKLKKHPTLRLSLRAPSQPAILSAQQLSDNTILERCRKLYLKLFVKAQSEIEDKKLDDESKLRATQENMKHLEKIFNDLVAQLNEQRNMAKRSLDKLTLEQQQEVVNYWRAAGQFLGELIDWLYEFFEQVLEKIKQGYKINKKELQEIFDQFYKSFDEAFKQDFPNDLSK